MCLNSERFSELAVSEHRHGIPRVVNKTGFLQSSRRYFGALIKQIQSLDIDLGPTYPMDVCEAALEREPAEERQVASLAIKMASASAPSAITFGPASGSFTLPGRDPATDSFWSSAGSFSWSKIVQLQDSSTFTRCGTLAIIPLSTGVSV